MLQQTQVARVIPAWHRFLERFPDPPTCATAGLDEVLRLWHGLGYPRRARNLHGAAAAITRAGAFPGTLDALLALPGVGPYTARAVLVFAFERDAAVVDTNIARVLARLTGARLTARAAQAAADALLPAGDAWVWNQVLMDLGATVCRPTPHCGDCPLVTTCAWALAGCRGPDPAVGSAGVSARQAPYAGSDREARGRLLARLLRGAVDERGALALLSADGERASRVLAGLIDDGLVVRDAGGVRLPSAAGPPALTTAPAG
jgi:A/G-specific adenine glycosylase